MGVRATPEPNNTDIRGDLALLNNQGLHLCFHTDVRVVKEAVSRTAGESRMGSSPILCRP